MFARRFRMPKICFPNLREAYVNGVLVYQGNATPPFEELKSQYDAWIEDVRIAEDGALVYRLKSRLDKDIIEAMAPKFD